MKKLSLSRLTSFLHRFARAIESLGATNAFRVLVADRFRRGPRRIHLRSTGSDFHYRGWEDAGVISHFYQPGYHIVAPADRPVRRIIDAGANIGDETLRFRLHHPDAEIVAIEPEPGNFEVLMRNFDKDPKVHPIRAGLWSSPGRLRLVEGSRNEAFRVTKVEDGEAFDVEAVSVPSVMEQFEWNEIDILKLDIEGAEYEVFKDGASTWLPQVGVIIFECPDHDRPGTAMTIFGAARGQDFNVYVCGENIVMIRRGLPWSLSVESQLPRT